MLFIWQLGCSISKCQGNSNCVLGRYVGFNYFDIDDDCIATEKMWVSDDAYQNSNGEESKPCIVIINVDVI